MPHNFPKGARIDDALQNPSRQVQPFPAGVVFPGAAAQVARSARACSVSSGRVLAVPVVAVPILALPVYAVVTLRITVLLRSL